MRLALAIGALNAVGLGTLFGVYYSFIHSELRAREDDLLRGQARAVRAWIDRAPAPGMEPLPGGNRFRILDRRGATRSQSDPDLFARIAFDSTSWRGLAPGEQRITALALPGGAGFRALHERLAGGMLLQTLVPVDDDAEMLQDLWQRFWITLALILGVSLALGYRLSRRTLRGVDEVTRTALMIVAGDHARRVPLLGRGQEIDHMALAFNGMIEKLSVMLSDLREITDNLAHDLKSPLTRLRGSAERVASAREEEGSGGRALAESVVQECDRLLGMINTALELAEVEAGALRPRWQPIDLEGLAGEMCDLYLPAMEEKDLTLSVVSDPATAVRVAVRADAGMTRRIVANLLDNALKYTPPGGRIIVRLQTRDGQACLSVQDSGPGIPRADQDRIFDRFYRGDSSRTQSGSGLGLSLARALARAHAGDLTVSSTEGQGSVFTLRLPAG